MLRYTHLFARSLAHSLRSSWERAFVYKMNESISCSFNPLCVACKLNFTQSACSMLICLHFHCITHLSLLVRLAEFARSFASLHEYVDFIWLLPTVPCALAFDCWPLAFIYSFIQRNNIERVHENSSSNTFSFIHSFPQSIIHSFIYSFFHSLKHYSVIW